MCLALYLAGCIIPIGNIRGSSGPQARSSQQFTEEQVEEMVVEDELF